MATLFLALSISLIVHYFLLRGMGKNLFQDLVLWAYVVNLILAAAIFYGLFLARKKLKNALGFLFMAGSFLKFIVFFLVFYGTYKADGEIQKLEFAAFFVPYLVALVIETFFASKMLNQATDS